MQPLFEHRLELAGYGTRALELEGDGPPLLLLHGYATAPTPGGCCSTASRAPAAAAVALDMPGFGTGDQLDDDEPILPQLDALRRGGAGAVRAGRRRGGVRQLARRLRGAAAGRASGARPRRGRGRWRPRGSTWRAGSRWSSASPLLRALLASPVPMPAPVLQRVVGEVYRRLAFHRPGDARPADRGHVRFPLHRPGDHRPHDGHRPAADPRAARPVPARADRLPRAAGLGPAGRDGVPDRADRVLDAVAESQLETIEDCGHCPQLEAPDELAELLLDFPDSLARAA